MKNDRRAKIWKRMTGVTVAVALLAGCTTTGSAPANKAATSSSKKTTSTNEQRAKKPAQQTKPKLAMPQIENPVVPPVVIPPFDWQNAGVAPGKRAEVLAMIEKKEKTDEFDAMICATDMDGKQLGGFLAAVADREARLLAWERSDKGKRWAELKATAIPAAREGTDAAKLKTLATESSQLNAEYGALRVAVRSMVMGVMNLQQQRMWAAQAISGNIFHNLRGVKPDADQRKKAQAICAEAAAEVVKEDTVAKDPYLANIFKDRQAVLDKTTERIKAEVLTQSQRSGLQKK